MLLVLQSVAALGLLANGVRAPTRPTAAAAPQQRSSTPLMMPKSTPMIPYKYPGMDSPQWVNIYNRMYRERIMFLGEGIDDNLANQIIAVLLYLESEDALSPVGMYCNIGYSKMKSSLALYDTMRTMPYPIQTVNLGMSAQMGAFLVAGGTKGMRYALPNSRFAMVNPSLDPPYDNEGKPIFRRMQATEMQLEAEEGLRDKKRMLEGFSEFTGRSVDVLRSDFKRDFYLSANEALEYGLVDKILMPKNPNKNSGRGELSLSTFESQSFDMSPSSGPAQRDDGPQTM